MRIAAIITLAFPLRISQYPRRFLEETFYYTYHQFIFVVQATHT
jgi:hypothetical protein